MTTWQDVVVSTSTGSASTAKTKLNTNTDYTTPSLAGALVSVTPVHAASAARTSAESSNQRLFIESQSIGLSPKVIALTPSQAILNSATTAMCALLREYNLNTALPHSALPLSFYGQAYSTNTAAFLVGATLKLTTEDPTDREVFWDAVTAVTSSGTAAASVALPSITANGGTQLVAVYANEAAVTITASKDQIGYLTVQSNDLTPQQIIKCYYQPVASSLANVSMLQADTRVYSCNIGMRPTVTLNATNTQDVALTSLANVVWGCAYLRN